MFVKSTLLLSLLACLSLSFACLAADEEIKPATGQEVAFTNKLGNCLACHAIPNDPKVKSPGNIGPALIGIKARYPDRAKLRAQIWDATATNPKTSMPPFGKNKILTEAEIDMVTDYIYGM